MLYILIALICFALGYILGIYTSKKAKQEIYEILEIIDKNIKNAQKSINRKIDELQKKLR